MIRKWRVAVMAASFCFFDLSMAVLPAWTTVHAHSSPAQPPARSAAKPSQSRPPLTRSDSISSGGSSSKSAVNTPGAGLSNRNPIARQQTAAIPIPAAPPGYQHTDQGWRPGHDSSQSHEHSSTPESRPGHAHALQSAPSGESASSVQTQPSAKPPRSRATWEEPVKQRQGGSSKPKQTGSPVQKLEPSPGSLSSRRPERSQHTSTSSRRERPEREADHRSHRYMSGPNSSIRRPSSLSNDRADRKGKDSSSGAHQSAQSVDPALTTTTNRRREQQRERRRAQPGKARIGDGGSESSRKSGGSDKAAKKEEQRKVQEAQRVQGSRVAARTERRSRRVTPESDHIDTVPSHAWETTSHQERVRDLSSNPRPVFHRQEDPVLRHSRQESASTSGILTQDEKSFSSRQRSRIDKSRSATDKSRSPPTDQSGVSSRRHIPQNRSSDPSTSPSPSTPLLKSPEPGPGGYPHNIQTPFAIRASEPLHSDAESSPHPRHNDQLARAQSTGQGRDARALNARLDRVERVSQRQPLVPAPPPPQQPVRRSTITDGKPTPIPSALTRSLSDSTVAGASGTDPPLYSPNVMDADHPTLLSIRASDSASRVGLRGYQSSRSQMPGPSTPPISTPRHRVTSSLGPTLVDGVPGPGSNSGRLSPVSNSGFSPLAVTSNRGVRAPLMGGQSRAVSEGRPGFFRRVANACCGKKTKAGELDYTA